MKNCSLVMPGNVYCGEGEVSRVTDIVIKEKAARVALFTGKNVHASGLTKAVIEAISAAGAEYRLFTDLATEPTVYDADKVIKQFREYDADLIAAVGGGSIMDIAKLCSILADGSHEVFELLETPGAATKTVPTLMIPTTAGTGSEATPNSIVSVPEKELKVGIVNPGLIADYVILDPDMIKAIPLKIAAATGIDALAHAMECYTSKKATPFSDIFALKACGLIFNNIVKACTEADAVEEKTNMLMAAFLAGVAIANSGTTIVHALSYPLGGKYHIAHGVSNAMLLAEGMSFNKPFCTDRLADIYDAVHGGAELSNAEKADAIIDEMCGIIRVLEIPTDLTQYGVAASDLETLVDAGMQVQRLLVNNCRPVTAEDARAIYKKLMHIE